MAGTVLRTAGRRSLKQIRHVEAVAAGSAPDAVARVYRQCERDFGMIAPPVSLHSPAPGVLAAAWCMLRETLVATGKAGRDVKEAVAAGVSAGNACPFCVEVHGATLSGLGRGGATAESDGYLAAVTAWARESGTRTGAAAKPRPFPAEQAAELIGVAVAFQYLNRMVNIFLGDTPLPPAVPSGAHSGVLRVLGRFMGSAARRVVEPGDSLDLLPDAPLPADLRWAADDPAIAGAFARAAAAIDEAGARSVPPAVRELVLAELSEWDGERPALGGKLFEDKLSTLDPGLVPAARLALLTAFASHRVDADVVAAFRTGRPADAALIELTSWASLAAATTVGSWLGEYEEVGK